MRLFRNRHQSNNVQSSEFLHQSEALIPAEVHMLSGCHSVQTSADVSNVGSVAQLPNPAGRAGGACTSALLEILYRQQNRGLTFQQLLLELRKSLDDSGFSQIPQLTSSRPLELKETPFYLAKGNGERRALLVGINYRGQYGQLSGCHNDVYNMKQYIMKVHGFPEHNITVLVDNGQNIFPTRQKIIAALKQLVAQSVAGDSVYFHYSGHGGLLEPTENAFKSSNKDYDETLYPVDHERSGQIRDFSLFNHFVRPMAAGVTVTCVMDCCHSGSVLDLPYSFRPTEGGKIRMMQNMSSLSNLAFLYVLAGGILPSGFEGISHHIGDVLGGDLDDYQGTGIESEAWDDVDYDAQQDGYQDYTQPDGDYQQDGYQDSFHQDGYQDFGQQDGYQDSSARENAFASPDYADGADYADGVVVPGVPVANDDLAENVVQGFAVPGSEVPNSSFGDNGDYINMDGVGEDGTDVDCGCMEDILGSILDADF